LLRDGNEGIEVFMVRRHLDSEFVGGAYVFPGGAVDPADSTELARLCEGLDDATASAILGVESGGLRFYVAAVREVFEEAGVLLAYDRTGGWVEAWDPNDIVRYGVHRRKLNNRETTMTEICRSEGVRLAVDRLAFWSHWVTPPGPPRRFDTRFFLAAMPALQDPLHDSTETVASMWVRPVEALERAERGEVQIILPTARNLESLLEHQTVADALMAAQGSRRGGSPLNPDQPETLSDLVTRVLAANPSLMTGPGTNTYVVGKGPVSVIDVGPDDSAHLDAVEAAVGGRQVVAVLSTHHHSDHAPGCAPFAARVGAPVLARAHARGPSLDRELADGEVVEASGARLRAVLTPGHASDHLCFWLEEESALFSGDHIMSGSTVVISPPDGHMDTYLASLRHVLELAPRRIYPGHGPVIDEGERIVEEYLAHRNLRKEQVARCLAAGVKAIPDMVETIYTDTPTALWPVARRSVQAHLHQLAEHGRARCLGDPLDLSARWEPTQRAQGSGLR
jgi:glyoxylase-like metal-dependent hydrolase (beta-lactamase superfamily II)/8-oxo-dGTP pyrophosphatase MutT (NUDIX family)